MDAGPSTSLTDRPVTASRRRILARTRLDFWLDALLLAAYTLACIASGILISEVALPALGITGPASSFWRQVHDTTATLTLILVPIHAALRWRWIVGVARRFAAWRPGRSR